MENVKLTKRQEKILQIIIEEYNNLATPIGSNFIIEKYFPSLSSATIRNDMVVLEKANLISKHYLSSGRIPTLDGYKYYNDNLNVEVVTDYLKNRLHDVLSMRNLSINEVIGKAVEIINENIDLPSVISTSSENDLLKKIDLVQINSQYALVVIITSTGEIIKREVTVDEHVNVDDLSICINIFNDRLVDTPMNQIKDKLKILEEVIKMKVKNKEFAFNQLVTQLFDNIKWQKHVVKGSKNLLSQPEFANIKKLKKILTLLEDVSIWQQMAYKQKINKASAITFEDTDIEGVSIATTNIKIKDVDHQVSIVGPNRVMYAKANALLKFLKEETENMFLEEENTSKKDKDETK